ncbi:uncharacterized protein BO95DRAFT_441651, partial [Aspergillus brunneoviolaceus CBS 621.78]
MSRAHCVWVPILTVYIHAVLAYVGTIGCLASYTLFSQQPPKDIEQNVYFAGSARYHCM